MKKVLIGICGIGNGHVNRQICVIEELIAYNYQVIIATQCNTINIIKKKFPDLKVIEIDIPWIVCNEHGLVYNETLEKYNNMDLFKKFLEFGIKVETEFGSKPDLIISDYEPNVAQYAYSQGIPLITMEQQSKFLYIDEIKMNNHSIMEEVYRINYFFPKFEKKIISSFFPLDIADNRIIQVPPIISKINKEKTVSNLIIVYLSPYSDSEKYEELIKVLIGFPNKTIKVFSKKVDIYKEKYNEVSNMEFLPYCVDFKDELAKCEALITTGGHQLISEAISLEIPLYVMPLETYEQEYNAYMVQKYGLGTNAVVSKESISNFFNNLKVYSKSINEYKKKYYQNKWQDLFMQAIGEVLSKEK